MYVYGVSNGKLSGSPVVASQRLRNFQSPNKSLIFPSSTFPWFADSADVVDVEFKLSTIVVVGIAPPSFMHFPEAQSKTARCQSVELAGHETSPDPVQSAPSQTQKELLHPFVSCNVTVVTFPALLQVTHAIPFPVSPLSPFGISKSKTAAVLVPVLLTFALHPASSVVVVPAAIVAAVHGHH